MDKTFRVFDPGQGLLLPPSLDDWLAAEHLARFIAELVDEHLDLSRIRAAYTEGRGGPPYDPRLMVRILLYGYTIGVRSSRAIEVKCSDDVAFRWLAAGAGPDYRAIARFRKRHLSALGHLFVQALALCQAAGMVRLGRVALDGTKVRANASKRKAMSYARMSEKEKVLADEVSALLAEAERIDKAEDARYGKNNRGDELPEELRRRETRRAKIREAKAALEEEAARAARQRAETAARDRGEDEDTAAAMGAAAADAATPKPKAQRNFTDPDSKIMLTGDGAFHQCYNAQAVVDEGHQVIVATDMNTNAADAGNLIPMTEQTAANTGQAPGQMLADAGYCSADNLERASKFTDQLRHRVLCGDRAPAPRRAAAGGRARSDPEVRDRQAAHGPHTDNQERPRDLCPPQGDRRTGLRSDEHTAKRQTPVVARTRPGSWGMAAASHLPQPTQTPRRHRCSRARRPTGPLITP